MRNQVFVQEHHLLEAVRRNVINEHQMQEVLSISRAMGQSANTPDLSWLTVVQSVVIAGIALGPTIPALERLHRGNAAEVVVYSLVAMTGLLAAAHFIRRFGLGKAPAGIAAAGAAMWAWGLGAGLVGTLVYPDAFRNVYDYSSYGTTDYAMRQAHVQLAYLGGDVTMVLAAIAIGLASKIPATAMAAGIGLVAGIVNFTEWFAKTNRGHVDKDEATLMLIGTTVVVLAAAFGVQRASRATRFDPAFWLHSVGIFPLGVAGIIMIDREAGMALPWAVAAALVIAAGVYFDRKSYIVAGAAALLFYLPFGAAEARAGDMGVGMAFSFSAVLVAVAVLIVRKVYVTRAAQGSNDLEQTVWS